MMSVKVMMRGGITYGKLYHSDGIVYGLAMIDAYNLESKCAIYPRVVVNGSALVAGIQCGWDGPDNEQEVINEITMRDEDGKIFVDFMSQWQETDDNNAYLVVLCTTNKTLDKLKPEYSDGLYIE
ncbi:hypothetical protein [Paenibacillus sp. IITD108]|uniref:hypothetical protein n=1 Tax=Paenibacillus sp. IITD108 TaxID=3116649 RepID=UPI002F3E76FC